MYMYVSSLIVSVSCAAPQQSWGHSFNFSVWFVELRGEVEGVRVRKALRWMEEVGEGSLWVLY